MSSGKFNSVVKKLSKKKDKLVSVETIKQVVQSFLDDQKDAGGYTDAKAYKYIYHLKTKGYLLALKKDLFYVTHPDEDVSETEVIDRLYWQILHTYCRKYFSPSEFYIGGTKALEIHLGNETIPQSIDIINRSKKANQVVVTDHDVCFKTYFHNGKNLFPIFKKCVTAQKISGKAFRVANKELALLESLYSLSVAQGNYTVEIVKKVVKKFKKYIDPGVFAMILRAGKHHASMNRLYQIIKGIDATLAAACYDVIKRYSFVMP